jgi:hypothetical protein
MKALKQIVTRQQLPEWYEAILPLSVVITRRELFGFIIMQYSIISITISEHDFCLLNGIF